MSEVKQTTAKTVLMRSGSWALFFGIVWLLLSLSMMMSALAVEIGPVIFSVGLAWLGWQNFRVGQRAEPEPQTR